MGKERDTQGEGWCGPSVWTTGSKLAAHAIVTRRPRASWYKWLFLLACCATPSTCCRILNFANPLRKVDVFSRGGPNGDRRPWSNHVESPTIFHARNLILSDVNQRRESEPPFPYQFFLSRYFFSLLPPFFSTFRLFDSSIHLSICGERPATSHDNFHNYGGWLDDDRFPRDPWLL